MMTYVWYVLGGIVAGLVFARLLRSGQKPHQRKETEAFLTFARANAQQRLSAGDMTPESYEQLLMRYARLANKSPIEGQTLEEFKREKGMV